MHMAAVMGMRGCIGVLIAFAFACASALACAQAVEADPDASSARFNVTLTGQFTKGWNYVTTRVEGECTVTTHVVGSRVVTLRSSRPTIVTATSSAGRTRFSPAVVRFVTVRATQGGSVTTTERGIGCGRRVHVDCAKLRRTLANQRPGLHDAEGELSEQDLFRQGIRFQTAYGSSVETTNLEDNPDGRVLSRVSWSLAFRRR